MEGATERPCGCVNDASAAPPSREPTAPLPASTVKGPKPPLGRPSATRSLLLSVSSRYSFVAPAATQKSCGPSRLAQPRLVPLGHTTSELLWPITDADPHGVSLRTSVAFAGRCSGNERTQPFLSSSTKSRSSSATPPLGSLASFATLTAWTRDGSSNRAVARAFPSRRPDGLPHRRLPAPPAIVVTVTAGARAEGAPSSSSSSAPPMATITPAFQGSEAGEGIARRRPRCADARVDPIARSVRPNVLTTRDSVSGEEGSGKEKHLR